MEPGHFVYRYLHDDDVVYVGRTINMDNRVSQHRTDSHFNAYLKENNLGYDDLQIEYISLENSTEEDITEKFLINKYKPILNTKDKHESLSLLFDIPFNAEWQHYVKPAFTSAKKPRSPRKPQNKTSYKKPISCASNGPINTGLQVSLDFEKDIYEKFFRQDLCLEKHSVSRYSWPCSVVCCGKSEVESCKQQLMVGPDRWVSDYNRFALGLTAGEDSTAHILYFRKDIKEVVAFLLLAYIEEEERCGKIKYFRHGLYFDLMNQLRDYIGIDITIWAYNSFILIPRPGRDRHMWRLKNEDYDNPVKFFTHAAKTIEVFCDKAALIHLDG